MFCGCSIQITKLFSHLLNAIMQAVNLHLVLRLLYKKNNVTLSFDVNNNVLIMHVKLPVSMSSQPNNRIINR